MSASQTCSRPQRTGAAAAAADLGASHTYVMAGLRLRSAIALPELADNATDNEAGVETRRLSGPVDRTVEVRVRRVAALPAADDFDGTPVFHPAPGARRLVVPGRLSIAVRTDGTGIDIDLAPAQSADDPLVAHLVVDHAVPRLLVLQGETVLHATCATVGDAAIAFLGSTGAGKSTMALGLCQDGARLVADDCLVARPKRAGGAVALPSYPSGRVLPDSAAALRAAATAAGASGKARVRFRGIEEPVGLGCIYLLERVRGASIEFERLGPAASLWALAGHSFAAAAALRPGASPDRGAVLAAMGSMRWLADAVPVVRLRYPSDLGGLADVRAAVRSHASIFPSDGTEEVTT